MANRVDEISLRELRRVAALGDMPWYQTHFTQIGLGHGVTHLTAGSYGWISPQDASHSNVRDVIWYQPLGHVRDMVAESLRVSQHYLDVTIRITSWGEGIPRLSLSRWRSLR